jgi:predicted ATPase
LECEGFGVIEEAATDVIALEQAKGVVEPWTDPCFIDLVVDLQKRRQLRVARAPDKVQSHDRSAASSAKGFIRAAYFLFAAEARRITYEEARRAL